MTSILRGKKSAAVVGALAMFASGAAANATVYTADPNLPDFLHGSYATLSNFFAGDVSSPYTPTNTTVNEGLRVYDGGSLTGLSSGNNWILATFSSPTATIEVLPNIDHFGAAYDGYQYTIEGSNDGTTWTPLYDTLTVAGVGEPFTIGTSTGTAPWRVNNVLTPGAGPGGTVGYEAFFNFGTAYKWYAFGASTEAFNAGNSDQELSGVLTGVPEPATWALMLLGFMGLGYAGYRKGKPFAAIA
jgi:hypothetical protein